MKLEVGKRYVTRDGRKAKVDCRGGLFIGENPAENNFQVKIEGNDQLINFICEDGFAMPTNVVGGRKETSEDLIAEIV